MQKIHIGCDHAGFILKEKIIVHLQNNGYEVIDAGGFSLASCDYPDYAHKVAAAVSSSDAARGILICGSGQGVMITANKHAAIRAALAWTPEIAALARAHNNANIVCLPARFISEETAFEIIETFFATPFEGGRHQTRVDKIDC